ncbi:MAG: hypothetical protein JSR47_13095 [Proteobacteria bacterium]|nr:hypothetical protein [Pseudomonadota bacterium]MBS0546402.1 hypothetical protein [Pseudomonadota bacterium]
MANPFLVVVLALLTIAGLGGVALFLLRPAKEEAPPAEESNVHHVDFGGGGHTLH